MNSEYYYLKSSLPEIKLWQPTPKPLLEVYAEIASMLNEADKHAFRYLILPNDHMNIAHFLTSHDLGLSFELTQPCCFQHYELQLLERNPLNFNGYLYGFLVAQRDNLRGMSQSFIEEKLMQGMLEEIGDLDDQFLMNYFKLDLQIKTVYQQISKHLLPESYKSQLLDIESIEAISLFANNLDQLGVMVPYYARLVEFMQTGDLIGAERYLDAVRWENIENLIEGQWFSRNEIFAYFLKYMIASRWNYLDENVGNHRLDAIRNQFAHSFSTIYTTAL